MKNIIGSILLSSLVLLFVGCAAPVINVNKSNSVVKPLTQDQVGEAIESAAFAKNWKVRKVKDGLLEASLRVKRHVLIVSIPYNSEGYKINYKDSEYLKYNPQTNTIHRSYNKWVNALVSKIDTQLTYAGGNGFSQPSDYSSEQTSVQQ